jgi:Acetyltransferase (GNAT) domain
VIDRRHQPGSDDGRQSGTALTVLRTSDVNAWAAALAASFQHDFHHLAGYHRVAERRGEGTAFLFTYRDGAYLVALPLLLRPVDEEDPGGLQDATSVYGYGGPISSHERMPSEVVARFHEALRGELISRRVVAVFSRLHPLILAAQRELLVGLGQLVSVGRTVSVDLTLPADQQWAGYRKKCRRIIEKTRDAGVVCVHDEERVYRREWAEIYGQTMRRVHAAPSYLYDGDYFELLASELGSVLHLFVALVDGTVAAGGLFTICDGIVQAHLGAVSDEFLKLSPTRLVDDTGRRWAHERGARVFHLGGGVGGREDSLFQYKAGFSGRRHEFATWQWIVDAAVYEELCLRRENLAARPPTTTGDADYFPAYRRPADREEPGT